jgi:tetratricopeptide (TPR) repeat protein
MSDDFYRRLSLVFGFFAIAAIFAMQTFVSNLEIKDLDLWLHLGLGKYIVHTGFHIPTVDILSCTIAGSPWVNHEWLFQVILYLIYQVQGPNGLILMQVVLTAVTGLLLFLLGYRKEKQFLSILLFLFTALLYQMRFTIRPDLYSLFFFVVYIWVLSVFLKSKWSIAVLFVVQVLWSNMHGFFFFGPFFIMIALAAEWMKRHVPLPWEWKHIARLTDQEYRHLKSIFVVAILACLMNPLTFKGAWYPIGVFLQISGDSAIFFDHIMELKRPIDMSNLLGGGEFTHYKLLILISAVSFIFNRRRIDIGALLFWLVFLVFSLAAVRNVVYFAFSAYLVSMKNISELSFSDIVPIEIYDKKFVYIVGLVFKVLLILWVGQYIIEAAGHGYFDFNTYERKSEFLGVSQRHFPDKAVDFLVENKIKGNMFNEFNSGAYVVGKCFPDVKVYIDGRTEVYGPDFFKHYLKIVNEEDTGVLAADLDKYGITIALLNTVRSEAPEKILKFLYDSEEWELVYLNYDGCIFLKNVPEHQSVIDQHRIDLTAWTPEILDEYRLGSRKVVPYQNLNRAFTLDALGFPDKAIEECRAALRIYPGYPEVFSLLGKIYARDKKFEEAFHYFRMAVTYDSEDRKARTNLAKMYEELAQYDEALNQYRILMDRFPDHPAAYFFTARVLTKKGEPRSAIEYVREGFSRDKNTARDILALGDLLIEKSFYAEAVEILAVALQGKLRKADLYTKIGDAFEKMGDMDRAREEWQKAIELTDENGRDALMNRLNSEK